MLSAKTSRPDEQHYTEVVCFRPLLTNSRKVHFNTFCAMCYRRFRLSLLTVYKHKHPVRGMAAAVHVHQQLPVPPAWLHRHCTARPRLADRRGLQSVIKCVLQQRQVGVGGWACVGGRASVGVGGRYNWLMVSPVVFIRVLRQTTSKHTPQTHKPCSFASALVS